VKSRRAEETKRQRNFGIFSGKDSKASFECTEATSAGTACFSQQEAGLYFLMVLFGSSRKTCLGGGYNDID
jgi:hypothetical protein